MSGAQVAEPEPAVPKPGVRPGSPGAPASSAHAPGSRAGLILFGVGVLAIAASLFLTYANAQALLTGHDPQADQHTFSEYSLVATLVQGAGVLLVALGVAVRWLAGRNSGRGKVGATAGVLVGGVVIAGGCFTEAWMAAVSLANAQSSFPTWTFDLSAVSTGVGLVLMAAGVLWTWGLAGKTSVGVDP